jgi:ribonuclease HII
MPAELTSTEDHRAFEKWAEKKGFKRIAGVDEAGRGPLAGPVVSAAVILPKRFSAEGLTDSKKLTPKKRARLFKQIRSRAIAIGVGVVEPETIDRINILQASLLSMSLAVKKLSVPPDFLLIDGKFAIETDVNQRAIIKGDSLSISISAASVIAKVHRDRIMTEYHAEFPCYGFDRHKGYPTKFHKKAIAEYGCCPIHRKTFRGVKEYIQK